MPLEKVIIVGAGPSGLLLTLLLSRASIPVELIEQTEALDTNPRASHYSPESCYEFDRAGILDEVREAGFVPDGVSWRRLEGENKSRLIKITNPLPQPGDDPDSVTFRHRMVCLPLHKLGKLLETHVKSQPTAEIKYGWKVVDIGEDTDKGKAWVKVEKEDGTTQIREADYVVGCDGANSIIRRKLFGDWVYPGYTWDKQIVATNIYYDGFKDIDYDDSQFFVHPEHWHMVARIQPDGLYRVTYGEVGGLTYDQLKERHPAKFQAILPGNPTPDQYKLVNFSPYKVHQRCVDKMRVGRFLLAADAAHLCNPFGGMGLTGGIADVGSLYDSLRGIHNNRAYDSILDKYDEVRRKIWHDVINSISTENMQRLFQYANADEFVEKDPFYKLVQDMQNPDKKLEKGGPPNATRATAVDL
ncbi:putative monooxygenase [Triangularia verruculosa]|uniref:Monooxygenase n=1 Tax=Triangularia verruculosa TaxID=2587418 RepID=A0AAN6X833_9PEZI|nr:putative monooxygenase [Triangularia verruculosa]